MGMKAEAAELAIKPPDREIIKWKGALVWHSLGFATVIILLWSDEFFELAFNYYGGNWAGADLQESAIRTVVVIFLWLFSYYRAHRVLSRLSYLESFMHVCAWCKRIEKNDDWKTLEQHLAAETGKQLSHGICPECASRLSAEFADSKEPAPAAGESAR